MNRHTTRAAVLRGIAVVAVALVAVTAGVRHGDDESGWWSAAVAAESGHSGAHSGGGHSGGGHAGGHGGSRGGGHSDHGGDDHGDDHAGGDHGPGVKGHGSHGTHRGGHGKDVARGGGKAVETKVLRGRRPVWAREGIPAVEMGRLNVSRAPGHILARAEGEALATWQQDMAQLYNLDAEQAALLLATQFGDVTRYDSPLQNLALYKDLMIFGDTRLREIDANLRPASRLDLAAIFLGSASDKTIPVSEDTVTALNRILGLVELDPGDRATLADKADTVRAAILIGHGPAEEH
jgi:hypothetical protein